MVPSRGTRRSGGKGPVVASASLAVDIISHGALEAWEAWEEAPTGRTRTCSVIAKRGATQARRSTATAARTEEEVMTCADMNCTHNGGHQKYWRLQDYKQKDRMENGR